VLHFLPDACEVRGKGKNWGFMAEWTNPEYGDDASDDELFRSFYPKMRRFAAVAAPPHVEADDLLQDALVATLRKHHLADLDNPETYLRRVMLNLASNHRRRWRSGRKAERLLAASSSKPAEGYPSDLSELMWLSSRQRAVLYLSEVEGYRFAEIAEMVGGSAAAARMSASRGRRRLRLAVSGEG